LLGSSTASAVSLNPPRVLDEKRSGKHLPENRPAEDRKQTRQREVITPSFLIARLTDSHIPDMTVACNLQSPTAKGREEGGQSGINNDTSTITRQWCGNLSRNTYS